MRSTRITFTRVPTRPETSGFPGRSARVHAYPMERRDLYEDDLTDERGPTPAERDDVAHSQALDPDILGEDDDDDDEEDGA